MCCKLQYLGLHTSREGQRCCKLQHLCSHTFSNGSVFWDVLENIYSAWRILDQDLDSCHAKTNDWTQGLHNTSFALKFEFKWFQHPFWWFVSVWFLLPWISNIVFTTVPWIARGTPVFVRETSSSKWEHVLVLGNFDINYYWITIVHGLGRECKTLCARRWGTKAFDGVSVGKRA